MKIDAQYEERLYAGSKRPPLELLACSEWVVTVLAPLIRLVGLTDISSHMTEVGGKLEAVTRTVPVGSTVENPFKSVQGPVAMSVMNIMNIFGLKSCGLKMSDAELKQLEADWLKVKAEIAKKTQITLNVDTDPTDSVRKD